MPAQRRRGPSPLTLADNRPDLTVVPTGVLLPRDVDLDRPRPADPHNDRFWRAYLILGYALLTSESAVVSVYLLTSMRGPNRPGLLGITVLEAALGLVGVGLAGWLSRQPWRESLSLAWSISAVVVLAYCAHLDGGLDSPLLFLAVLPVVYASAALRPRQVAGVGAVTSASIVAVGATDTDVLTPQESLLMFSAFVLGLTVLSVLSARHRRRLQADQQAMMERLTELSVSDTLTGCRNQRMFHQRLAEEVDRANRHERPLSLIVCDVDLFKDFNDLYGHDVGDAALATLGVRLRAHARSTDVVARIGGDEFALLLPETSATEAAGIAARILDDPPDAGSIHQTSLSLGVAVLDPTAPTATRLFRDADQAMYEAKGLGRSTYTVAGSGGGRVNRRDRTPGDTCADGKRANAAVRYAQREKLETELILDTLLQLAPVAFAFVDRDFRVLRVNATLAAMNEQVRGELVGGTLADLAPSWWPHLEPLIHQVLREGTAAHNVELTGVAAADGEPRPWLASLFPVRVGQSVIGIGLVCVDITDRKRLEQSQLALTDAVIRALTAAVEARDPYTAGHQLRVADIARAITDELGYDSFTAKGISLAAAIHDIGKVAVPAEILSRPGRLTVPEMEIVKTHAEAGYNMLAGIEFPWPVADMVLQHHERLDGSGYPAGLRGEHIGIGARIIAVADVVEAMSAHRPYRAALGIDAALTHIEEARGTLFDPVVVDACLRLFHEGRLRIRATVNQPNVPLDFG